ncbi:hypothetical protein CPB85DRAFT_692743 [Mucidula mucida]|nr:hypothetical protein CPB85DRAFT_692743 [Mucidula mucida]
MSFYQPLPSTHFPSTAMVDDEHNFFDFSVPKNIDQLATGTDFFENFENSSSWYPNYHNVRPAHPSHSYSAPLLAPNFDCNERFVIFAHHFLTNVTDQFASASQLSSWPLQEQTTSYISRSASPPLPVEAMPQSWCPSSPSSNDETPNSTHIFTFFGAEIPTRGFQLPILRPLFLTSRTTCSRLSSSMQTNGGKQPLPLAASAGIPKSVYIARDQEEQLQ